MDDFEPGVVEDERNRTIDDMSEDHCKSYTRFKKHELRQLYLHLRIPETFRTANRYLFTGEESMLIFLTRVGGTFQTWRSMEFIFGGDSTA